MIIKDLLLHIFYFSSIEQIIIEVFGLQRALNYNFNKIANFANQFNLYKKYPPQLAMLAFHVQATYCC